jgi:hypothetical protein
MASDDSFECDLLDVMDEEMIVASESFEHQGEMECGEQMENPSSMDIRTMLYARLAVCIDIERTVIHTASLFLTLNHDTDYHRGTRVTLIGEYNAI